MEFRVLGPLEVIDDGRAIALGGQKQRALLALLLLEVNRPVSRERLVDALWEEEPTATAAKALQVYVSQLRKALGRDRIATQSDGYLLRAAPDELDLERFRRLCDGGKPQDALALWRGEPLAEFAQHRFAQADIARLEELYLNCLEARIEADIATGRSVVGELEGLVHAHPLRERLRELLLLALYRAGRQADALAAYQDARRVLVDELGIEPAKPLRDLHQAILRQDPALDPAPSEPSHGAFVGRDAELEQLVGSLADAIAGRGRLFLLVGEPGIGKSRLAEELISVARARRVEVLVGRCWEAGGAPAYWPWVQALRAHADGAPPELAALLRGVPAGSESESARFRLFDATVEFLRTASREQPLLLVLDDMHAADEPSLLLLRFLARELAHMRLVVVVACRDVDPSPSNALGAMLAELAREPLATRLSLRGLSEQAVADYVEAELASRELAPTLYEETEGNPLFLTETVRLLALEGRIAIPPSLRDVIARRLAHLSDECNRRLLLAAVLGREFDHAALAAMSGIPVDELLEALDEAMRARVVSDVPGARARSRFAHVLIRDALYEGLTSARRARLHRKAVEVLERLGGNDTELAYHAVAGNDLEKARVCARRAGDRALALLAYEEAARLYDVALSAEPDERTRCELLLERGEAEIRAGRTADAKETFLGAAVRARQLGLSQALARAALGYGGRILWVRAGDDERLVPLLEEALAALPAQELELRARLLGRLAGALRDEHTRDRREALSLQSVELGRVSGNPAVVAYALDAHGYAIIAPDTLARCLGVARELRSAAAEAGDKERVIAGHMLALMAHVALGEIPQTKTELDIATRLAGELRQRAQIAQAEGVRAMLALAEGRLAEGEILSARRHDLGKEALLAPSIAIHRCQRHALHDLRNDLAAVEAEIAELATLFPARPVFRCVLAQIHARIGRTEDAARALSELATALPFDQEWLYGMSLLAETAALVDDADSAHVLHQALSPWAKLNAVDVAEGCRGAVSRYLGLLAATLGRREEAAAHFEHAMAMNEGMGFAPFAARTREDYERTLSAAPA
jgi:DNA-binding SARP family transcriptional activator/tetratricopeptide (TPR) repeat protein